MRYRSVCTGIAAETVAWTPLGWETLSFSEIEPFCCALLKQRYPGIPNYGDFTQIKSWQGDTDLLMGGTPCQSFSVAGRRGGLHDPRGNLALEFVRLAQCLRARWIVWENVKGVLSSDGGEAFGSFLGALAECGYGFAYRVFDAQFDGLAQRRQRVFVVGYLGDWRPPAAVLFERESLRRDTAPSREAGQEVATTIGRHAGGGPGHEVDNHGAYVSMALNAHGGSGRLDGESETFVACPLTSNPYGDHESRESLLVAFDAKQSGTDAGELAPTLRATPHDKSHANGGGGIAVVTYFNLDSRTKIDGDVARALKSDTGSGGRGCVMHTLSANGFDASEDGTGRGTGLVAITGTLSGGGGGEGGRADPSRLNTYASVGAAVRRLTPLEWERLMGLPDGYSAITYRGKPAADGPRYKAIGNSISVPTLAWIGRRIDTVDKLLRNLRIVL